MAKPTIFFSHSSHDQPQLARLKELFIEKTGGSIDVFLSSDGQSIPLGRNWVHQIEEALEHAPLMVVFVSPNSLRSSWLFFESGFAYSKKIRVVPVGFLGVDLATLPPPLSLLQGFNIISAAGLNNLIAVANEVFQHSHPENFTVQEFQEVNGVGGAHSSTTFGDYGKFIDQVQIELSLPPGPGYSASEAMVRIAGLFDREKLEYETSGKVINLHGISFSLDKDRTPPAIRAEIDATLADVAFPIVEKSIREVISSGVVGTRINLHFTPTVGCIEARYKITGRMFGTDVKLAAANHLIKEDLKFTLGHLTWWGDRIRRGAAYIDMELLCDRIPVEQIKGLLSILFDREVLFLVPEVLKYYEED